MFWRLGGCTLCLCLGAAISRQPHTSHSHHRQQEQRHLESRSDVGRTLAFLAASEQRALLWRDQRGAGEKASSSSSAGTLGALAGSTGAEGAQADGACSFCRQVGNFSQTRDLPEREQWTAAFEGVYLQALGVSIPGRPDTFWRASKNASLGKRRIFFCCFFQR